MHNRPILKPQSCNHILVESEFLPTNEIEPETTYIELNRDYLKEKYNDILIKYVAIYPFSKGERRSNKLIQMTV